MSTSQRESTPQPIQETDPTQPTNPIQERVRATKPSKKRQKSSVWDHFAKIRVGENAYKDATCNHCHKKFAWSNMTGTSTMKKHIEQNACRNFTCNPTFTSPRSQHVYDQDKSRKDFAIACVKHNYPFNMSEHEFFEVYIKGINPYASLPSRNTVRSDVIGLHEEEKTKVYNLLDSLDCKVSLTTDMWTSDHSGKPYCCVTAHYIDDSWELHKIVIAFKVLPYPHDADNIFNFLKERILEWNLDRKLCAVVVDNATANTSMILKLKEWLVSNLMISRSRDLLHVRCSAHILNLVVQYGIAAIRGYLVNIRKTVKYLDRNPSAKQNFDRVKQLARLQDLRDVAMDVPTRWNSTFELLETALPLREAFERFALSDRMCEPIIPPDDDLDVLKWWCVNSKRLPILQKIARDILAIPATTVASESAFSLGGRIIDEEHSQLGSEAVESLVTLKDWIPPINKISRQSKPITGVEVGENESEWEAFDDLYRD